MSNPVYQFVGSRIPYHYFFSKGHGTSNYAHEAGSYDSALKQAGIENYNIIQYTSVIPPQSREIEKKHFKQYLAKMAPHGAVLECIMSTAHGLANETVVTGLMTGHIYDKAKKEYLGGYAVEYMQTYPMKISKDAAAENCAKTLLYDMSGVMERRHFGKLVFSSDENDDSNIKSNTQKLKTKNIVKKLLVNDKTLKIDIHGMKGKFEWHLHNFQFDYLYIKNAKYGTSICCMGFVDFLYPFFQKVALAPNGNIHSY